MEVAFSLPLHQTASVYDHRQIDQLIQQIPQTPQQQNPDELKHFITFRRLDNFMDRACLNLDSLLRQNYQTSS